MNGKTGIELVEEWLEKHNVLQYVDDITWEKPRAEYSAFNVLKQVLDN